MRQNNRVHLPQNTPPNKTLYGLSHNKSLNGYNYVTRLAWLRIVVDYIVSKQKSKMYNIHMEKLHIPVLLSEVLTGLSPQPKETYLDLTAGYGGHASKILDVTQNYKSSVLVDRDEFAAEYLKQEFPSEIEIINTDFYRVWKNFRYDTGRFWSFFSAIRYGKSRLLV